MTKRPNAHYPSCSIFGFYRRSRALRFLAPFSDAALLHYLTAGLQAWPKPAVPPAELPVGIDPTNLGWSKANRPAIEAGTEGLVRVPAPLPEPDAEIVFSGRCGAIDGAVAAALWAGRGAFEHPRSPTAVTETALRCRVTRTFFRLNVETDAGWGPFPPDSVSLEERGWLHRQPCPASLAMLALAGLSLTRFGEAAQLSYTGNLCPDWPALRRLALGLAIAGAPYRSEDRLFLQSNGILHRSLARAIWCSVGYGCRPPAVVRAAKAAVAHLSRHRWATFEAEHPDYRMRSEADAAWASFVGGSSRQHFVAVNFGTGNHDDLVVLTNAHAPVGLLGGPKTAIVIDLPHDEASLVVAGRWVHTVHGDARAVAYELATAAELPKRCLDPISAVNWLRSNENMDVPLPEKWQRRAA